MTVEGAPTIEAVVGELARLFRTWGAGAERRPKRRQSPEGTEPVDPFGTEFHGDASAFTDEAFDRLARRIHRVQFRSNPVLRRFWGERARDVASWEDIPPVPTAAFKEVPIVTGTSEAVFCTSGTSEGPRRRGEHHVGSLDLYWAAAQQNYRRHLLKNSGSVRVVSLIPHPDSVPSSSLAAMAGFISREPEVLGTAWIFSEARGVDAAAFRKAATADREPILLLATAFALVQLLETLKGEEIRLPEGSRLMETGGFKGRVAEVAREGLYRRIRNRLGVSESHVVNEYGMTELLSQAYDGEAGTAPPLSGRKHHFPPWVRTRALDPASLAPLPPGVPGLLAHYDLANAASVCHVLTEDLGETTEDGGFRLAGRAAGAELRGCSLAAESFLREVRKPLSER